MLLPNDVYVWYCEFEDFNGVSDGVHLFNFLSNLLENLNLIR